MTAPTLGKITREVGLAGQYAYSVPVTYPSEPTKIVSFVGWHGSRTVVMVTGHGHAEQTYVTPNVVRRCGGTLSPDWIREFFS